MKTGNERKEAKKGKENKRKYVNPRHNVPEIQ
jgi:hypothetical protein